MKYLVKLPDGTTKTRNSHRTYTHAIAVRRGDQWEVTAFCGSPDLATKERTAQHRRFERLAADQRYQSYRVDEIRILPAEVQP